MRIVVLSSSLLLVLSSAAAAEPGTASPVPPAPATSVPPTQKVSATVPAPAAVAPAVAAPVVVPPTTVSGQPGMTPTLGPPSAEPADEELGLRMGLPLGLSDISAGGLLLGGVYQTRLTTRTSFDAEAGFTLGGGGKGCVQSATTHDWACEHAMTDGLSLHSDVGFRYYFDHTPGGLVPYARGALGFHIVYFSGDHQIGAALPVTGAAGARMGIAKGVFATAEAALQLGPGLFTKSNGLDVYSALSFIVGVDFAL